MHNDLILYVTVEINPAGDDDDEFYYYYYFVNIRRNVEHVL